MATTTQTSSHAQAFVLWALDQLGLEVSQSGGVCRVSMPENFEGPLAEEAVWVFTFDPELKENSPDGKLQLASLPCPFLEKLVASLCQQDQAISTHPAKQPESVHELTNRLFTAYTVDGGNVHLGGCAFENRPFLRLSYFRSADDEPNCFAHAYFDSEGVPVEQAQVVELGLDQLEVCHDELPKLSEADLHMLVKRARAACQEELPEDQPLVARTLVWCKYAIGKLMFTIGDAERELNFSGWARTLLPPPVRIENENIQSYHLAATDDGKIVPIEEIEVCSESGRRTVRSQMVQCSVSGKWMLSEFAQTCPVSGKPVAPKHLVECSTCHQQVSTKAMSGSTCRACRAMKSVSRDDPRMARLLGEHPGLDRCRSWKLSESASVYITTASLGLLKLILLVVDKETLEPRRIATGNRFLGGWTDLEPALAEEVLR